MKIAVLSGKGGTGKTLIAVNLSAVTDNSLYVDCDVEEPNGKLFLKPENIVKSDVTVLLPEFNLEKCTGCRVCTDFCAFNALAFVKDKPVLFADVCHSCGGCKVLCPAGAVEEIEYNIGEITSGNSGKVDFLGGMMIEGNATGTPIIKELYNKMKDYNDKIVFVDCPPGTACTTMDSIKDADYCVIVAEPTIFGAHNLEMVYELVNTFNKPFGVVLNKCTEGINPSEDFCVNNNIKILARIPFDYYIGKINSEGKVVVREKKEYHEKFESLIDAIYKEATL